jgi:signal transduction histidine kinase
LSEDAWEHIEGDGSSLKVETDMSILADSGKLLNVFENMFLNSIEHNDDSVEIVVGELEDKSGFYIEDDGVGVDDDTELFEPNKGGPTRFGLLITSEIIKAHGWEIDNVPSENGARFEIITE